MTIAPIVEPKIGQRIAQILFITQSLGSAALIANATVNPIVGSKLGGSDILAGVPGTLLLLGAAIASYPAGILMQRIGAPVWRWASTWGPLAWESAGTQLSRGLFCSFCSDCF